MSFIKNNLLFREVETSDLALLRSWRNDPKMSAHWNTPVSVQTDLMQSRWYTTLDEHNQAFVVEDEVLHQIVGLLRFRLYPEYHRAALTGTDVAPVSQRKNYGSRILKAGAEHILIDLGYHRVTAECMDTNVGAFGIIQAAGFKPEGVYRDYVWRAGRWHSWHVFSLLSSDLE